MTAGKGDPRTRARVVASVVIGSGVLAVVCGYLFWTRPLVSDAEVAEVGRAADEAYLATYTLHCPRPVLRGDAIEGDGTSALREVIDLDGAHAACFELLDRRGDELREALEWTSSNRLELAPGEPKTAEIGPPLPAHDWEYLEPGYGLRSMRHPLEDEVLTACAGVAPAVRDALQHASVCGVAPMGADPPPLIGLVRATRALVVVARDEMRRGHLRRGMELLLDGVRLSDDALRGRPSILGAMMGVAVRTIVLRQIQGLMAMELPWAPGDLEELERQALVIAATQVSFERWVSDDHLSIVREPLERRGWTLPDAVASRIGPPLPWEYGTREDEAVLAMVAFALPHTLDVCAGLATREECLAAWESELARAEAEAWNASDAARTAPSLDRGGFVRALYGEALYPFLVYMRRAAQSEARVRALAAVFVHRRIARAAGACPDSVTLEHALSSLPLTEGFGGVFTVHPTHLEHRPLHIGAPAWLDPAHGASGPVRLPLLEVYCPALTWTTDALTWSQPPSSAP